MNRPIYLDHNASTPVREEVLAALLPWLRDEPGNPSSTHPWGRRAREAVEAARGHVAGLIGASADEIVFTSGGTEADNLAVFGVAEAVGAGHVVTSAIEHAAVAEAVAVLERRGSAVTRVGVGPTGRVDAAAIVGALRPDTALISVMLAHNEHGTLQPIAAIGGGLAGRVAFHTDASQAVGKVPIDVDALGVDLLTIAGHKLGAPKGIGALYVRRGTRIAAVARGGGQERGLRPGTENVAGIVALGEACRLSAIELPASAERKRALRDRLHERLLAGIPDLWLAGDPVDRLPTTLQVLFPGTTGAALLAACPEVAATTGSACHDGSMTPASALLAMGIPAERAVGAVRLSLGHDTTIGEVDDAARALVAAWHRVRRNG